MEGQLMYDKFFKDFYDQQKAEQKRQAALLRKVKIAVITIGVICLIMAIV